MWMSFFDAAAVGVREAANPGGKTVSACSKARRPYTVDPAVVRAWVARTRAARGLPAELSDPVEIARLADLILRSLKRSGPLRPPKAGPE